MDQSLIPEMIAALAFFGMVVICPLVMVFLRHQRLMAELIRGKADGETMRRLEIVEQELRELRATHYQQAIRDDDEKRLSQRIT